MSERLPDIVIALDREGGLTAWKERWPGVEPSPIYATATDDAPALARVLEHYNPATTFIFLTPSWYAGAGAEVVTTWMDSAPAVLVTHARGLR